MANETTTNSTNSQVDSGLSTASSSAVNSSTATTSQTETNTASDAKKRETDWEALIQKAVDRATNKLGNENKALRKENEELKKANLSEAELRQLEMKEKEKEIAEREQKLLEKENRYLALKAIKEIGLDDGSELSLELVDFVMAEDETAIKERVKAFNTLVERLVSAKVDKVFKANGRTAGKSSSGATETDTKKDSVAVRIGQNTAKANEAAKATLEHYIGGKK